MMRLHTLPPSSEICCVDGYGCLGTRLPLSLIGQSNEHGRLRSGQFYLKASCANPYRSSVDSTTFGAMMSVQQLVRTLCGLLSYSSTRPSRQGLHPQGTRRQSHPAFGLPHFNQLRPTRLQCAVCCPLANFRPAYGFHC